jgi:hypothetical protein
VVNDYFMAGSIHLYDEQGGIMEERASVAQALHHRNYQRARARALVRLSRVFKDEYKQFLEEERELDEQTGKTWIGFDSTTGRPITIESYKDAIEGSVDPDNEGENEGNSGGEA